MLSAPASGLRIIHNSTTALESPSPTTWERAGERALPELPHAPLTAAAVGKTIVHRPTRDVGFPLVSGAICGLLAIGLLTKRTRFRRAGLESLIAHAAAALTTQALKHLIGRPRPRMTHGGGFQFGPSWDAGLDSFPSGHAAASFAVAAVLARRFPRAGWFLYGVASFVALSRVMRGSHFPTDVLAGVGLFGVMAYLVAQRTHEIGLRLALGAQRSHIFALILGRGMLLTLIGVAGGLIGAYSLNRVMRELLPSLLGLARAARDATQPGCRRVVRLTDSADCAFRVAMPNTKMATIVRVFMLNAPYSGF